MDPVRWLDDDELATWMGLASAMVRIPALLDRQMQQESGISHFEYGIMATLSTAPARTLQMSFLARFANGSLSRLSHAVRRLEDRGFVLRTARRGDGRFTEATLTGTGWAKVQAAAPGHVRLVRALVFDRLTDVQIGQLRAITGAILGEVGDESACDDSRSCATTGPDA